MFPIALDLTRIPVLLAGSGELLEKRLAYLDEAKARRVAVYSEAASESLKAAAGPRLVNRLPRAGDVQDFSVVMVAGLERAVAERIVGWARVSNKLVNVEDVNDLCDFYFTANVRRGDLVIAVSTGGASPTLARKIRDRIAHIFGEEWAGRVRDMAEKRRQWKAEGKGFHELIGATERYLAEKGWLKAKDEAT